MRILNIILLIFISGTVCAQKLSLQECLKIAMENNYSLQITKNESEMAENNHTRGNAGFLPTVDATARYSGSVRDNGSKDFSDIKSETNGQVTNTGSASVNASWDIFAGMKAHARYALLGELKEVSDLKERYEIENLIANVVSEYYYLTQQERHRKNLEFFLDISRERLRIASINKELGSASRMEILQAQVDLNSDSSRLVRQKQHILSSKIRLKTLMGELDRGDIVSDTAITLFPELDYDILMEKAINENTQLLIAARQINISENDLKVIRAGCFPYLRLSSGYSYNYNSYSKGGTKNSYNNGLDYGLTLGFNIFNGNNRRREIKNAKLAIQNKELSKQETEQDIKAKLQEIYVSYANNLSLVLVEEQNLTTAVENFKVAAERYKLGELAPIDLREAQNSLRDAEERLLDVQFNAKIDEVSLMVLSGNIIEYL